MKLLFDQNLSRHLVQHVSDIFHDSTHVLFLDLEEVSDKIIWDYALKNDFTIVTQDADYYDMAMLFGYPPKVVILCCGNTSTKEISKMLRENYLKIIDFTTCGSSFRSAFLQCYYTNLCMKYEEANCCNPRRRLVCDLRRVHRVFTCRAGRLGAVECEGVEVGAPRGARRSV